MTKCPYSFSARSRSAMREAILAMANPYNDGPFYSKGYVFSWNVKLGFRWPSSAAEMNAYHYDGGKFDASLDSEWDSELDRRCNWVIESMQDQAQEYSTWPGDDQGAFKFDFVGRQGGHMCLSEWRGIDMRDYGTTGFEETMERWDVATVRALYRALVCMTADFTRDKVREALAYSVAFERGQWEEQRREQTEAAIAAYAAEMVALRPDMYAGAL